MPVEWSGLGPGLLLTVDRESAEPLRAQLERQLRDAIRTARLCSGERLPSSRALARELGLSRGLVQECYEQLQAEGYLTSHTGSATRVAPNAPRPLPATPALPEPAPESPPPRIDFAHGVPDLASFPRTDWLWSLREASRTAPNTAFGYGDPAGCRELRGVLSAYLRRVRSACAEVPNTIVCSGFGQGLGLVLRVLAARGVRTVAFEDPGYPRDGELAAAWAGVSAVPVPVDDHGIDVEALDASGARAVVLTPAHQWPTGVVLAPHRRLALLDWAETRDATIIEDDYDAEFRYDREPVGALQGLCPDRVVSLGTVSKSLAPSLRLGWMVCPPALSAPLTEEKRQGDRGSPVLDQLALAMLMESGRYDKHLRRMRATYGKRREVLVTALAAHAPAIKLTGLAAGFHAVAHLPEAADESTVITAARERSVGLYGMSRQRSTGASTPPQLVLGFGNLPERLIAEGVETIADLLLPISR